MSTRTLALFHRLRFIAALPHDCVAGCRSFPIFVVRFMGMKEGAASYQQVGQQQ